MATSSKPSPNMPNTPNIGEACPFLSLPIELRNLIYSYLLSTKYTREDMIKTIAISNDRYKGDHYVRSHTYHFQTAILRCNHQINDEATAVFQNTNLFVSISHNYASNSQNHCDKIGFPILARGGKSQAFKGYAMEIYLGKKKSDPPGMWWDSPKPGQWEARPKFMIAADDLLEFCKNFFNISDYKVSLTATGALDKIAYLKKTMLLVDVLHTNNQHTSAKKYLRPAVQRLLEPLGHLHNIGIVIIECPAPNAYVKAIAQSIQRKAPSAQDLNNSVISLTEEGDAAFLKGDFQSAALQYETAFDKLQAGSQRPAGRERMIGGGYTGAFVTDVKGELLHRLQLGLAKANFQMQNLEMAHHWTLNVVRGFKDTDQVISQMWYYRALASKGLGEFGRAYKEMRRAQLRNPNDPKIRDEMAAWSDLRSK